MYVEYQKSRPNKVDERDRVNLLQRSPSVLQDLTKRSVSRELA
jgi:hypothetical protein